VRSELHTLQLPAGSARQTEVVLVYGGNGWIGTQLCAYMREQNIVHTLAKRRVGHDTDTEVCAELRDTQPTHVLCVTGRTGGPGCLTVDYLDGVGAERTMANVCDNLYSVVRLCRVTLIHLSTGATGATVC
jgi:nucleoside-diphosphate-sugar epimerase